MWLFGFIDESPSSSAGLFFDELIIGEAGGMVIILFYFRFFLIHSHVHFYLFIPSFVQVLNLEPLLV